MIKIKAKFMFNAQFCGNYETQIEDVPDEITIKELKDLFKENMELDFDDNCTIVIYN